MIVTVMCLCVPRFPRFPRPTELDSGVSKAADMQLKCVARHLFLGDKHVEVVAFGTSVTRGPRFGAKRIAFPRVLQRNLLRRFPQANFTLSVYGYPGASIQFMEACINRLLPVRADIYIIECTDNFMAAKESVYREVGSGIERIMEALARRSAGGSATILLAPFAQSCSKRLARMKPYARLNNDSSTTARIIASCYGNIDI